MSEYNEVFDSPAEGFKPPEWPTLARLASQQDAIEGDSFRWLLMCKGLAERRIPKDLFQTIPETIWRFRIAGSKVLIMRAPQTVQYGSIIVPDGAKEPNEVGWVLTVGPNIVFTDEQNVKGRTFMPTTTELSDFTPLLAVGDLVLINRHAGQEILTTLIDGGMRHRSMEQEFLLISIADVFGPLVGVKTSDWSSVQEVGIVVQPDRRIVV